MRRGSVPMGDPMKASRFRTLAFIGRAMGRHGDFMGVDGPIP